MSAKWKERFRDSSIIDCVRTLNKIKTEFAVGFSNTEAMKDPEKKLVFVDHSERESLLEQVQGRMAEEFKTMSMDNFLEKYGCKLMQKKIGR